MIDILINKNANNIEKFSANELSNYLSIMANSQIKVTDKPSEKYICVGCLPEIASEECKAQIAGNLKTLHDDGFIIKSYGNYIVIKGNTPRGTLYGVYDYLQRLGARFYFPGKENEFIPKREDVFIDEIDVKESPDFYHRSISIHFWESSFLDWIDFSAKTKMNAIHIHSDDSLEQVKSLGSDRGLEFNIRRHFFSDKYSVNDSIELEKSRSLLRDYIEKFPADIKEFFLWPADVTLSLYDNDDGWAIPDVVLAFTNEMSKVIKSVRPEARMSFLAYWSTWGVPQKVKPLESVFLEIAHMHQCFSHSIADPLCQTNLREVSSIIDGLLQIFEPSETHILGYWLDASLFGRGVYKELEGRLPYIGDIIKQDFRYYKDKGVRKICTFAVGLNRDYFSKFISPTVFQYPALLWDVNTDLDSEIDLFCENYFGDRSLSDIFKHIEHIDPRYINTKIWDELKKYLSDSETIIGEALNSSSNDIHIMRIEKLLNEFRHVRKWVDSKA